MSYSQIRDFGTIYRDIPNARRPEYRSPSFCFFCTFDAHADMRTRFFFRTEREIEREFLVFSFTFSDGRIFSRQQRLPSQTEVSLGRLSESLIANDLLGSSPS
jgi:hypothetical protein